MEPLEASGTIQVQRKPKSKPKGALMAQAIAGSALMAKAIALSAASTRAPLGLH